MLRLPIFGVLMALMLLAMPARAEDVSGAAAAWQDVITSQVEAFRANDGATALSFSVNSIQASFPNPQSFVRWIKDDGYAPIVESVSHSFGAYHVLSPDAVVQDVRFTGADLGLYVAQYWLRLEGGAWHVQRVHLSRTPGIGV